MFCPNCGEKLNDGSKFCSTCGEAIDEESNVEKIKENVKTTKNHNMKIIIGLAVVIIILAVITIPLIINNAIQPEIIVPEGFALESDQSGILTYAKPESYEKIDIQESSIPSKDYPNENVGVLKTLVNNTEYIITIHGKDFHDSYMREMASIAQKRIMYMNFDEMISNGHLDSSLDDIQFYGDFEGFEVEY